MTLPPAIRELTAPSPALYTIPAGRPFLADLAQPILKAYADEPEALADLTIFLPNRRAVRSLAGIFHELGTKAGRDTIILPRLRALGDVDEEDLLFSGTPPRAVTDMPPAGDPQYRRLILANLVRVKNEADWPGCLQAADELAKLIDSFHLEDVPLDALTTLVPPDVVKGAAEHWQKSLTFLSIVMEVWPEILSEKGWMEATARQRQLLGALTAALQETPPTHPMIVAGSLGTVPATGRLMAMVAGMPAGLTVLPGLDTDMDDRAWAAIEPPHPQALFRLRLERDFGGAGREMIRPWPVKDQALAASDRRAFLSMALRPADATDDWYERFGQFRAEQRFERALEGFHLAVADTEDQEASFISLLIRGAVATPDRTVMLVTPDRQLARRVAAKLLAWGIEVDDSGGVPVGGTYRGTFLRLVAGWLADPSDPVALIALLGHELTSLGRPRDELIHLGHVLDRLLRGVRPAREMDGLISHVTTARMSERLENDREALIGLLNDLDAVCAVFREAADGVEQLAAHITVAERLADMPGEDGTLRLWRYEDGEQLAQALGGLLSTGALPDEPQSPAQYPDFYDALIGHGVVRKRGGHPRIAIYGLLEARLQTADRIILGGLNEGVWPDVAPTDAFLSRPMRDRLGLPSPEQMIGRAAHDFAQAAAAPDVVLTRSARRGRDPATPSRWLVRVESFLKKAGLLEQVTITNKLRAWDRARQWPDKTLPPLTPPVPRPPVEDRPRQLSVTDVERLLRDPYAIYARHILKLPKWEPLNVTIGVRERGILFHDVMQRFAETYADDLPDDIPALARDIAMARLGEGGLPPALGVLWGDHVDRFARFVSVYEREARADGQPVLVEGRGEWTFDLTGGEFTLRARADRIDNRADGTVSIVDFKTGEKSPTAKQQKTFSPQLILTAMMVEEGGFADLGPARPSRISFLKLAAEPDDRSVFDRKRTVEGDELTEQMAIERGRLMEHLGGYFNPDQPYPSQPRPFFTDDYGDYDHLARRGEWAGNGGDE